MIATRRGGSVDLRLGGLLAEHAVPARQALPEIDRKILRHVEAVRARTAWLAPRAISRLPLIVSFAVAFFCAACGQTGPLTLDRPVDAAAATERAVVQPDEPDAGDEPDDGATDGGAPGAGER